MTYIRKFNDPALSAVCAPVMPGDDFTLIADMKAALRNERTGVGLAAPQIGVLKRVCIIWHRRQGGECIVMVNPRVVRLHGQVVNYDEGCLSYPGVIVPVSRYEFSEVEWRDRETWQPTTRTFGGFQSRVVQHELDHLDGICRVGEAWRSPASPSAGRGRSEAL